MVLAVFFLMYGIFNGIYFVLVAYVEMFRMTPSGCSGPGCNGNNLTCAATQESSYHLRVAVMTIGSLIFGVLGINSVYNKYAIDMFQFSCWVLCVAALYLTVGLLDGAYLLICDKHYSYNLVQQTVLSSIFGFMPFNRGIQYEIKQLDTYPRGYVDTVCYHNVAAWFAIMTLFKVGFFAYAAFQAFILAQRFHYGMAGMGATFSIGGWQERLKARYDIDDVGYNTFGMACATAMDVGWEEGEYQLQRPLRQPQMYRGAMMPGAAATAYNGFQDDRRNVLL